MIKLVEINESNLQKVIALKVTNEQKKFVPSPAEILSRAWIYRNNNAVALAAVENNEVVGLALIYDLNEEPCCYFLMEMLVDYHHQNKGYAQQMLKKIIEKYSQNPKYPVIELSVDRTNYAAIHTYEKCGFVDSGYVDADLPHFINMTYKFNEQS